MKTQEIRTKFLDYFNANGHAIVNSSSLVPKNDNTLLFTNAGMVQFKDIFLGATPRSFPSAVSAQRCVRAGGKHNDLDNVGFTARHHTFFEMLGNFSFGDYFKEGAIDFAWVLLTDVFKIPEEKLWVTVYFEDKEAESIWRDKIGVPKNRIIQCGKKDNFWTMGDTGPCGPCSEIFFDHGESVPGGPPGSSDEDGDRFVEIWNLVFMQSQVCGDGTMKNLDTLAVDTGMGLERVAAVLQGVTSNYDTDLFSSLIDSVSQLFDSKITSASSLRVIADHIRAASFLIADGINPSNESRGYVLRRIIRRALRHGHKMGNHDLFFHRLVPSLEKVMGLAYPLLTKKRDFIVESLKKEEERFSETLDNGMKILTHAISNSSEKKLDARIIFQLYDTYGFPVDLTADVAREHGFVLDLDGFKECMDQQRQRARSAKRLKQENGEEKLPLEDFKDRSEHWSFVGYDSLEIETQIAGIIENDQICKSLSERKTGYLILNSTPFYGESGGQVGDVGTISGPRGQFEVKDTIVQDKIYVHYGEVISGEILTSDSVTATVNELKRRQIKNNHSATHLMHAALREVLGHHVAQKGSLVDADRLRFDFSHDKPLSSAELEAVENLVNFYIRKNIEITTQIENYVDAVKGGAIALFGEKYGDKVRVCSMGEFSKELCGGTHAKRTGDLGSFKIQYQSAVGSGIRRVEGISGEKAEIFYQKNYHLLQKLVEMLNCKAEDILTKITHLVENKVDLEKQIAAFKKQQVLSRSKIDEEDFQTIGSIRLVAKSLGELSPNLLREKCDEIRNNNENTLIVLASVEDEKVRIVSGVSKNLTSKISAVDLVNVVAEKVGGKGGGRSDLAQAGGSKPESLDAALLYLKEWLLKDKRIQ